MAVYSQYHSVPTWIAVSSTATRVADGGLGTLSANWWTHCQTAWCER